MTIHTKKTSRNNHLYETPNTQEVDQPTKLYIQSWYKPVNYEMTQMFLQFDTFPQDPLTIHKFPSSPSDKCCILPADPMGRLPGWAREDRQTIDSTVLSTSPAERHLGISDISEVTQLIFHRYTTGGINPLSLLLFPTSESTPGCGEMAREMVKCMEIAEQCGFGHGWKWMKLWQLDCNDSKCGIQYTLDSMGHAIG